MLYHTTTRYTTPLHSNTTRYTTTQHSNTTRYTTTQHSNTTRYTTPLHSLTQHAIQHNTLTQHAIPQHNTLTQHAIPQHNTLKPSLCFCVTSMPYLRRQRDAVNEHSKFCVASTRCSAIHRQATPVCLCGFRGADQSQRLRSASTRRVVRIFWRRASSYAVGVCVDGVATA